ncbi:MAG: type II toxin-antitoxin system prevent-host-death family antitoxin [Nocardioides sp.]
MTKSVGVQEAKTHLSRLLHDVAAGEEVLITSRGEVVARLVPPRAERQLGRDIGAIVIGDDFDDPLPPDLAAVFGEPSAAS